MRYRRPGTCLSNVYILMKNTGKKHASGGCLFVIVMAPWLWYTFHRGYYFIFSRKQSSIIIQLVILHVRIRYGWSLLMVQGLPPCPRPHPTPPSHFSSSTLAVHHEKRQWEGSKHVTRRASSRPRASWQPSSRVMWHCSDICLVLRSEGACTRAGKFTPSTATTYSSSYRYTPSWHPGGLGAPSSSVLQLAISSLDLATVGRSSIQCPLRGTVAIETLILYKLHRLQICPSSDPGRKFWNCSHSVGRSYHGSRCLQQAGVNLPIWRHI